MAPCGAGCDGAAGAAPSVGRVNRKIAQLPAYTLIVIGGNLFKFSTEQIDAERKLRATQALAGSIAHEQRPQARRARR